MVPLPRRILAYDRARALAVIGMIFVNTSNMLGVCGIAPEWAGTIIDFICGRAAVVFVMLAGIGVTLAYDRASPAGRPGIRKRLLSRALWLGLAGILLFQIWEADILHFYAVYFLLGVWLLDVDTPRLVRLLKWVVAVSMPVCALLAFDYEGGDILGPVNDLPLALSFVAGYVVGVYYPVFPWFGFFVVGMLMGRLERSPDGAVHRWLAAGGIIGCTAVEVLSALLNAETTAGRWVDLGEPLWRALTISEAFPVNPLFVFSATASGVALIALCRLLPERRLAEGKPGPLVAFGRLSLTLYISHIIIASAYDTWIQKHFGAASSGQVLGFSASYIVSGMVFAFLWTRRFDRGPLERVMDALIRVSVGMREKPLPTAGA